MPLRIVTILGRLKQDLADELSPEAIEQACKEEKYSWRQRMLDPVTTVYLFILQILHGNTACSHVVHFGRWKFTDTAYCAARKRLPLAVLRRLAERIAARVRTATTAQSTWHGHRVWLLDGSSFSMPDTPELQAASVSPRPATGMRVPGRQVPGAVRPGHRDAPAGRAGAAAVPRDVAMRRRHLRPGPGDIALGDRGFCSYAHLAILLNRKLHGVFRASAPDHRLHSGPAAGPAGQGEAAPRGDDPAALAVGALAGRIGSSGHLVQAQESSAVDVQG